MGAAWLAGVWRKPGMRWLVTGLIVAAGVQLTVQAYRASYVYIDSPRNPYVYAHTLRSVVELAERVEELARSDPRGEALLIKVMAEGGDYWPLPWYLRRFRQVGWWGEMAEDPAAPVVIASPSFAVELERSLGGTHQMAGYYGLRPAVFLQLYVERGLWDRYLKETRVGE
jgi:predicted membrane-bound mannosyltransferase